LTWENVDSGFYEIYALASDTNGAITISDKVTILVGSGVTITSPYNNEKFIFPTDININVSAWDSDGSISGVEFFEDTTSLGTDDSLPYVFAWNDVQPGTYVLTAEATDNSSNIFSSDEVTINVVGGPAGYEFCSTEGGTCYFEGVANVAYGADGKFNFKMYITDSAVCTKEEFGDPYEGVNKSCYVQEVSPYVSITSPENNTTFTKPDSITFTVFAIDNDGTIDSVQYIKGSNVIGISKVAPFSFIWKDVPLGSYGIYAKAFDNDGNSFNSKIILITVNDVTEITDPVARDISLYPNPVFDELVLNTGNNYTEKITLSLHNILGNKVMEETLSGGSHILDLKTLPSGIYFIRLSYKTENIVRKIIKY
jgi:hypothetical protein